MLVTIMKTLKLFHQILSRISRPVRKLISRTPEQHVNFSPEEGLLDEASIAYAQMCQDEDDFQDYKAECTALDNTLSDGLTKTL